MREPRFKAAYRDLERTDDELVEHGQRRMIRKAKPPNDYDDLLVSTLRGQTWNRRQGK